MLQRTPDEERIVAVNGMEMHYESYGDGDPLVLLHGFFGCTNVWKPYIPVLSPHFRLIAVDLRGHGLSTNPSKVFTHRQAAYDTYALLDTLGIERFKAIGVPPLSLDYHGPDPDRPWRQRSVVPSFDCSRDVQCGTSLVSLGGS